MKRLFDILFSTLFIVIFSIPLMVLTILVFTFIGCPVFFIQERPGLNGRIFKMYKFRTMNNNIDKSGMLLPDDQRITKLGRFLRNSSLDELPEIFNVFKGDMSFVGPRPLLVEYLPLYSNFQSRRHEVKPGITGLAQINGRNSISWDEKFNYDVYYVDNNSFVLDLKILLLTVFKVVKREGVNSKINETMPKFTGNK